MHRLFRRPKSCFVPVTLLVLLFCATAQAANPIYGNLIWQDENGDGSQSGESTGITNVTVAIINSISNVVASTTTDASGIYSISYDTALWTPAEITTALWLDASDSGTVQASGSSVTNWNDKSGNNRDVDQTTGTKQPATGSETQNDLNVITADGGDVLG